MTDSAIASAVFVAGFIDTRLAHRSIWAGLLTLLLALPLAWRRRAAITTFLIIAVVAFAQWLTNLPLFADIALLVALYTVAAERPRRAALGSAFILEAGLVLAAVRWSRTESALLVFTLLSGLVLASLTSGIYAQARRVHIAALVERAARLEFERDQQARFAAAAERARISREMHDVMAHSLAVMISLANGATAKLGRDPEQSREALESISELGRQALEDTRGLLSVLRTEDGAAPRAPHPGLDDIAGLVERAGTTGLKTTLIVQGEPVPLATGPALAAYRIVQEATTNALKHAEGATKVVVELTWGPDHLDVAVTDDGRSRARPTGLTEGYGLAGIRERAALYGGAATAGPGEYGGWTVKATIPITKRGRP